MRLRVRMRTMAFAGWLNLLVLILLFLSCNKSEQAKTFVSPESAGKALAEAAKSGRQDALLEIFGAGAKDTLSSGDMVQDQQALKNFAAAYEVMNRWRKVDDKTQVLIVGADNNSFPIPLKKTEVGHWYFDTEAGKEELLARRIGGNELVAIDVCFALADAQNDYFSQRHGGDGGNSQYALRFISTSGKQDGLYWQSSSAQPQSPLGPLVAFATDEGYHVQANSRRPFYGYYYRILTKQGSHAEGGAKDYLVDQKMVNGFAFVAYPAEYGSSGIMTFIINQDGVVYQKDLGKETSQVATAMSEFDPDPNWSSVEE